MPVSRKSIGASAGPIPRPTSGLLPRRIVVFGVIRDESGSMKSYRQRQGEFIPQVSGHLVEVGGPKVGNLIYILYCVVSGGVVTTDFVPLCEAADPPFTPDGETPIGKALAAVAAKVEEFIEGRVFPQEVTIRNCEFLIVSDLQATGEGEAETVAGVDRFLAVAKKYRAKVNIVGPAPEAMNHELARRLDVSGRGIKYLDSDPKSVINITFDSILGASRSAIGGSNPATRNF